MFARKNTGYVLLRNTPFAAHGKHRILKASHKIRALKRYQQGVLLLKSKKAALAVCAAFIPPAHRKGHDTCIPKRYGHYKQIFFVFLKDTSWYYLYPMLPSLYFSCPLPNILTTLYPFAEHRFHLYNLYIVKEFSTLYLHE